MSTETTQDVFGNNLTSQIGDVVVVRYQIGKRNLHYLGVIQAVSNNILVQFLKRSGEKTFSIKDGDTDDSVSIENKMKLKSVSLNNRGQYVFEDNLPVNLDN